MPELPEVETVCRALRPHLVGRRIAGVATTVPSLRRTLDADALRETCVGRDILGVRRRAKYIVVELSGESVLVLHLGMTGNLRLAPGEEPLRPHDRVIWTFADGDTCRLADIRRFGAVEISSIPAPGALPDALRRLGLEPLSHDFNADRLYSATRGRSRPIKNLLLDQSVVAGVGNIYASEALFRAGVRPQRPSGRLGKRSCQGLVAAIKAVLAEAIEHGGTTISDFRTPDGSEGKFRVQLQVYGKAEQPCTRCGGGARIRRIVQSGRSSFYCPHCQR